MGVDKLRQFLKELVNVEHTRRIQSYEELAKNLVAEDVMTRLYMLSNSNERLTGREYAQRIIEPFQQLFRAGGSETLPIAILCFDRDPIKANIKKLVRDERLQKSTVIPYGYEYADLGLNGIFNMHTRLWEPFQVERVLASVSLKDQIGALVISYLKEANRDHWSHKTWLRVFCTSDQPFYVFDPWNCTEHDPVLQELSSVNCDAGEAELAVIKFVGAVRKRYGERFQHIGVITRDQDMLALCLYHGWSDLDEFKLEWLHEPLTVQGNSNTVNVSTMCEFLQKAYPNLTNDRFLYFCLTKGTDFFKRNLAFNYIGEDVVWAYFTSKKHQDLTPESSLLDFQDMVYWLYHLELRKQYLADFAGVAATDLKDKVHWVLANRQKKRQLPTDWNAVFKAFSENILYWNNVCTEEEEATQFQEIINDISDLQVGSAQIQALIDKVTRFRDYMEMRCPTPRTTSKRQKT